MYAICGDFRDRSTPISKTSANHWSKDGIFDIIAFCVMTFKKIPNNQTLKKCAGKQNSRAKLLSKNSGMTVIAK
jgi:hypothetical protein